MTVARLDPLVALDRSQTAAAAVIARIGPEHWDAPTPCDEWTVRDVANKLVASTLTFAALGRRQPLDPPLDLVHPVEMLGDDPLGAYQAAASECRQVWRSSDALTGMAPSTIGEFPAVAVLNARIFDSTILTTDMARAIAVDHGIDDSLAAYVLRVAHAIVDNVRRVNPDRYKDPSDPGPDSPLIERLVAATGRDPHWSPPG